MMTIKQKSIEHYEKMIAWAKEQNLADEPNKTKMTLEIGEAWTSDYCSYCRKHKDHCRSCSLKNGATSCCNGLWRAMDSAKTWRKWIKKAGKVLKYITKNDGENLNDNESIYWLFCKRIKRRLK